MLPRSTPYDFLKAAFWQNTRFPRLRKMPLFGDPEKPYVLYQSSVDVPKSNPYDFLKAAFWQNARFPRLCKMPLFGDPEKPYVL